ncbi:hypothetical protein [Fodinibius sp.]|uniref:hypothetical protein n=1 Tax=Fodinibius sp. TaxID=1872440 RepID=UPI003563431E
MGMNRSAGLFCLILLFLLIQSALAQDADTDLISAESRQLHPEMEFGKNSGRENQGIQQTGTGGSG